MGSTSLNFEFAQLSVDVLLPSKFSMRSSPVIPFYQIEDLNAPASSSYLCFSINDDPGPKLNWKIISSASSLWSALFGFETKTS
jgi:hypothetical protein